MHTVPEEEAGYLEAKATNSCELPDMGAGNSSPLQRQYMLLTPEPSISPVLCKDPDAQKSATHQNITNQGVNHESWFSVDITNDLLTGCSHVWEHSRPGQLPAHMGLGRVGPASLTTLLWRSRCQDAVLRRIYTHKHSSNTNSLSFKDTTVSTTLNQSRDHGK